jgi:hypothetical protein
MEEFVCEYCDRSFSTKNNLKTHVKSAQYCLLSRQEKKIIEFICENCGGSFSVAKSLKRHQKTCEYEIPARAQELFDAKEEKSRILLDEKDATIKELTAELNKYKKLNAKLKTDIVELNASKELAVVKAEKGIYKEEYTFFKNKPTTTNTSTNMNTTNNKLKMVNTSTIDPFTVDLVKARLDQFTYETFMLGEAGIKRFILGMIKKNDEKNYVTTDISRPNFHRYFQNANAESGESDGQKWIGDKGALFLTNVFSEMKPKVMEHWDKFNTEADMAESVEEHESFDNKRDHIKPVVMGINSSQDSKYRKELLSNVINHIKPHVAV